MQPLSIPGTNRQAVAAQDGTKLQRQYVYLTEAVWHTLQLQARTTGSSVSKIIASFANNGTENLKEQPHDSTKHLC